MIVFVALRFVNDSRTGRAWRSMREDPLAAEMMGMPVNWLKLMAFSFGAAVAALTGTIFASLKPASSPHVPVPAADHRVRDGDPRRRGSMAGVVVGAIVVNVLLEVLREPGDARYVFYVAVLAGLFAILRLSTRLAVVLGGTVVFGFAVHAIAEAISDRPWRGRRGRRGG